MRRTRPAGTAILGNSIHENAELAIQLGTDGVTQNDPQDADSGDNDLQNYPVLTDAVIRRQMIGNAGTAPVLSVQGSLNSTPSSQFLVQVFGNDSCDASGHGEGRWLLGSVPVTTDTAGNATFDLSQDISEIPGLTQVTATATQLQGEGPGAVTRSTSEFSACLAARGDIVNLANIEDLSILEGDSGVHFAQVVVRLTRPADFDVTLFYSTGNGTATAGSDYDAVSGQVMIQADDSTATISIPIHGDTTVEPNETFHVFLRTTGEAEEVPQIGIGKGDAVVTILNDDTEPAGALSVVAVGDPTLNPQTGLFEQTVRVTNGGGRIEAYRLLVGGLSGDVVLRSSAGVDGNRSVVLVNNPVNNHDSATLLLEYFSPTRTAPSGLQFQVEAVGATNPPPPTGDRFNIDRTAIVQGNRLLIEFSSTPGRSYVIEYSADMNNWKAAVPVIVAGNDRVQWLDDGPPKTDSPPGLANSRFYRVVRLP